MPEGHCFRYAAGPITLEPHAPEAVDTAERLEGRWLYGGLLYGHFGHFLCETTSRLWALDHVGEVDGIVFLPKNQMTHERRHFRHHLPFFAAMGLTEDRFQIRAPQAPVVIEELALAEPGFGIGDMIEGRPDFRAFMQANLGRDVGPDGPENIYISRSQLPSKRGSVLLETLIEKRMEDAGYTVFHPQNHDLAVQIATYKAARRIVSLDASSLHLAAMIISPETRVAILNRGPTNNIDDYIAQFTRWQGRAPTRIEAVKGVWYPEGRRLKKRETHATLDLPLVCKALVAGGFLPKGTTWRAPTDAQLNSAVAAMSDRMGQPLQFLSGKK
ncbi:glycosyltransferase family 61 protein [Rhodobacteraceae bacterium N5(2021)]|uniref:Glycosyltransferase family 61 protein n=1 Tax=Gymnodinialimonas phycosphaerae TaxID=2841589 RepID=A0A975TYZ5_9RHOB|nr:glycosyltransferase family 61 protein [Gymnodinialimonas phycosphaerae]MBY4893067.1 glycosyltransferase family 61 protein [Gymnodinialimonas phycosphaerae]